MTPSNYPSPLFIRGAGTSTGSGAADAGDPRALDAGQLMVPSAVLVCKGRSPWIGPYRYATETVAIAEIAIFVVSMRDKRVLTDGRLRRPPWFGVDLQSGAHWWIACGDGVHR
jgi:hypothetical protein